MFKYRATVFNIVDGDTIDVIVDLGFKINIKQRIRLAGIDTPEKGEPGYAEARTFLSKLLLDKEIILATEKTSKWGYYIGYISINDEDINQRMLAEGLARPYNGGTKQKD